MDKTFFDMLKAASSLTKMKNAKLDEQTARRLHNLIYKDNIEINPEEEEENRETSAPERGAEAQTNDQVAAEADANEALANHEISENKEENVRDFGANQEFMTKLESGEIRVESLTQAPLGKAIDGITLPKLPPIKTLDGLIGNCSPPFEKQLTATDLYEHQGKLTLWKNAVVCFLKPMLKIGREYLKMGIDVTVYNEKGEGFPLTFKLWSDKAYVLAMGWNKFSSENKLKAIEDWVTIWMFRHNKTDELCFAVIPRRFPITVQLAKHRVKRSKTVAEKEKGKKKKIY